MAGQTIDTEDFLLGMRQLAASVTMVTTLQEGRPVGLLATAVCSVSAEPPLLLACVNRGARSHDAIAGAGLFCVNVLRADQRDLALRFLKLDGPDRFSLCRWQALHTGAPAVEGALVSFDCTVERAIESGTHTVFIGRVQAIARSRAPVPQEARTGARREETAAAADGPLLYFDGAYADLRPQAARAG